MPAPSSRGAGVTVPPHGVARHGDVIAFRRFLSLALGDVLNADDLVRRHGDGCVPFDSETLTGLHELVGFQGFLYSRAIFDVKLRLRRGSGDGDGSWWRRGDDADRPRAGRPAPWRRRGSCGRVAAAPRRRHGYSTDGRRRRVRGPAGAASEFIDAGPRTFKYLTMSWRDAPLWVCTARIAIITLSSTDGAILFRARERRADGDRRTGDRLNFEARCRVPPRAAPRTKRIAAACVRRWRLAPGCSAPHAARTRTASDIC